MPTDNARAARLDALFGTPAFAVAFAVLCNCFWGSAFPFIKMGYRLFAIESADTASILCFAGVRFMLGGALVALTGRILAGRWPVLPRGKVLAECCALGLWQTTAQYAFYYSAVSLLTGAFGGILNSTQSFLGVILAHFLYRADRMTPAKAAGCAIGFAGVLVATIGNHGGGSGWGIFCMMAATVIFTAPGPTPSPTYSSATMGISRFMMGRMHVLHTRSLNRSSSGFTATPMSPIMVSGRVVATTRSPLPSARG